MSVDPVDDCTFWYVNQYYDTTGSTDWQTRIGSFKFPLCVAPVVSGAPTGVAGTAGDGKVVLDWTAPSSDGGAQITDYRVSVYNSSGGGASGVTGSTSRLVGSAATAFTFSGLTNGTQYKFKVAAVNSVGTGSQSALSASVTPGTPPGAPRHVKAVPGSTTKATGPLVVSFRAGASHGSAITGYTARCRSSNGGATRTKAGAASPLRVTHLTAGKRYRCTARDTNSRGTGLWSAPSADVRA